jgi:hypothetical protein
MVKHADLEAQALGNLTKSQQGKSNVASSPAYKAEYQKALNSMSRRGDPDEKIFYIVKSLLLGCFGSLAFLSIVFILGSIEFMQAVYLGIMLFVLPYIIGRHFEKQIDSTALHVTKWLDKHPRLKGIIVRYM